MGFWLSSVRSVVLGLVGLGLMGTVGCGGGARAIVATPQTPRSHRPAGIVEQATPQPAGVLHTVGAGQTLYAISRTYGVSVPALVAANDLRDANQLAVGQRVFVPGARTVMPVPAPMADTVGAGKRELQWPVAGGIVLSHFGAPRGRRRHEGIDIRGRHGQPVVAVDAGRVVYSGDSMRGYGKTVIVDHGDGMRSLYAHNSKLTVRKGERVVRGQTIARIGRTGNASTEHCHLEIRQNDVPRDPLLFVAHRAQRSRSHR